MKVKISFPWAADKKVGEVEQHYGVAFTVTESEVRSCVLVADLPEDEAQAMVGAGRVSACEPTDSGPTRDEMKAYLTEKGIEFANNIRKDTLAALYSEELAKAE